MSPRPNPVLASLRRRRGGHTHRAWPPATPSLRRRGLAALLSSVIATSACDVVVPGGPATTPAGPAIQDTAPCPGAVNGPLPCEATLAAMSGERLLALAESLRQKDPERAKAIALRAASRGDVRGYERYAQWLVSDADGESIAGDFGAHAPEVWAMARSALARAHALGSPRAAALLARLEAIEFPLAGRPGDTWLADVYFGRFDRVPDTLQTRSYLASVASATMSLSRQWEPPGNDTVRLVAALRRYLAPVQAGIPGRVVDVAPKAWQRLRERASRLDDDWQQAGASGVLAGLLSLGAGLRSDWQQGLATGNAQGRDAGVRFHEAVRSMRSPRGLRLTEQLTRAFEHFGDRLADPTPLAAAAPASPPPPPSVEGDALAQAQACALRHDPSCLQSALDRLRATSGAQADVTFFELQLESWKASLPQPARQGHSRQESP